MTDEERKQSGPAAAPTTFEEHGALIDAFAQGVGTGIGLGGINYLIGKVTDGDDGPPEEPLPPSIELPPGVDAED